MSGRNRRSPGRFRPRLSTALAVPQPSVPKQSSSRRGALRPVRLRDLVGVRMSGCWCTSAKNTSESETLHSVAASALHPHIVDARIRLEECVELSRQAETFSRPRTMPAMERTREKPPVVLIRLRVRHPGRRSRQERALAPLDMQSSRSHDCTLARRVSDRSHRAGLTRGADRPDEFVDLVRALAWSGHRPPPRRSCCRCSCSGSGPRPRRLVDPVHAGQ